MIEWIKSVLMKIISDYINKKIAVLVLPTLALILTYYDELTKYSMTETSLKNLTVGSFLIIFLISILINVHFFRKKILDKKIKKFEKLSEVQRLSLIEFCGGGSKYTFRLDYEAINTVLINELMHKKYIIYKGRRSEVENGRINDFGQYSLTKEGLAEIKLYINKIM